MIAKAHGGTVRLVALDLDGTLLDSARRVDEETARAIRALPARGVRAMIASARPPRSVRAIYTSLGLDTWQVNYNGALIWDEPGRRVVRHLPMEGGAVLEIIRDARALHPQTLVSCEIYDRWCTDRFDRAHTTETGKTFRPDVIAPVESFCTGEITKLLLLGDPAIVDDLMAQLGPRWVGTVTLIRSDPDLIQIMDRRASKAEALAFVARGCGVPMTDVLALGDALNDLEMLREAGHSAAVANAHPDVKAVADWVAPSNDAQGVLAALRHWDLAD